MSSSGITMGRTLLRRRILAGCALSGRLWLWQDKQSASIYCSGSKSLPLLVVRLTVTCRLLHSIKDMPGIDNFRFLPGRDICYHRTNTNHQSLGHARRLSLGFGNVRGAVRIARFSCPALSGSPRRFRSWGESLPIVHPRDVSMRISDSIITTNKHIVPRDLNKLFTLLGRLRSVIM